MNISDVPPTPFGIPLATPRDAVLPLSRERVGQALTRLELSWVPDEDGDPITLWDGFVLRFVCAGQQGEVFQCRAFWQSVPPEQLRAELLEWFNQWHEEHYWPKVFIHREQGMGFVFADVITDLEHGVTDAQLDQLVRCAAGTISSLFAELAEAFPQYRDWIPVLDDNQGDN